MSPAESSLFVAIISLASVALMVWWALGRERRAKLEPTWPTVTGLVTRSDVVVGKTNKPKIVYQYAFDGREYVGKVIQSNMVTYSGSKSPKLLCDKFPVGSRPTVYVNSSNPNHAVLVPGGDRTFLYFVFGLAAFFVLMAGLTLAMTARLPPA